MPAKIKVKVWSERLDKKIRELEKLTGRSRKEIVASAMDHFLRAAGKKTPVAKKKKRDVEKNNRGSDRLWNLYAKKSSRLKKPPEALSEFSRDWWKKFVFKTRSQASKYQKVKYRGISRMGWWGLLSKLAYSSTVPRGYMPDVKDKASKYSYLTKRLNMLGRAMAEAANRIKNISRYGDIAYSMAVRSTAKWMNAQVRIVKKNMQSSFNR